MQNIFEFFKTDKKALIFSKYREGEKLNFKDYIWLLKNAFFYELPKAFILGFPSGIGNFLRNLYFKKTLKKLGKNPVFGRNLTVLGEKNIEIGSHTWVDDYATLAVSFGELKIGSRCHICPSSYLSGGGGLYIGDNVAVCANAQVLSHSEIPTKGKSMAGPMIKESEKGFKSLPIHIKNNSFISVGAIILPGVTIGEGSIVGANSVVTKDVEPWTVVGGVPAKKIGNREK